MLLKFTASVQKNRNLCTNLLKERFLTHFKTVTVFTYNIAHFKKFTMQNISQITVNW